MSNLSKYVSESGKYIIPVSWGVYSTITVEADNLEAAIELANSMIDDIPLCTESEYIDGSYTIQIESDEDALNAQEYAPIGNVLINKNGCINK